MDNKEKDNIEERNNNTKEIYIDINNSKETTNNNKNGNILGIIALLLSIFGPMILGTKIYSFKNNGISNFFNSIGYYCPLIAIIILIIGRIKYPKNILLKVVMWFFISSIIIGVIVLLIIKTIINDIIGCRGF